MKPSDHVVRERFEREIDTNFVLNCSAGSGKTWGVSNRIASIAKSAEAEKRLASLAVVTFTKAAAAEMQSRARARILAAGVGSRAQRAFGEAFFGTIHAFAVKLLREFGYLIGVPASFESVADSESLWLRYLQSPDWASHADKNPVYRRLLNHLPVELVMGMVNRWDDTRSLLPVPPAPRLDVSRVMDFPLPKRADQLANIQNAQREIAAFALAWNSETSEYVELPCITKGGEKFLQTVSESLRPALDWRETALVALAGEIFAHFRDWRVKQGVLSYDDQVALAAKLLRHDAGRKAVRAKGYCVILDEAQDTDPVQFDLLLNCVLPEHDARDWLSGAIPAGGRFCMVGDMQQSIYGSRADLTTYRRVSDYLAQPGVGERLVFAVTFRCDSAIIDLSNKLCPATLSGTGGQVTYVPLQGRPSIGPGQVIHIPAPSHEEQHAEAVADLLATHKPAGLGATDWGDIAILVPRTAWFAQLRAALLRRGIRSVQLSQAENNESSPAFAWLTAVLTVISDPREEFEIVGLLREMFGLSDRALAFHCKGVGAVWRIDEAPDGHGPIAAALRELHELRSEVLGLPLRAAVAMVDESCLRHRLRALPASEYGDIDMEMAPLLALASEREIAGDDIRAFATHLRGKLKEKPQASTPTRDCVNLLTIQKAKGLEWSTVVLPFLARKISAPPPEYPHPVGARFTPARFAFDAGDVARLDPQREVEGLHELRRLGYVALTRAKSTLVLFNDSDGQPFAARTMGNAISDDVRLLTGLAPQASLPPVATPKRSLTGQGITVDLEAAAEAADNFRLKVSPHELASGDDVRSEKTNADRLRSAHASLPLIYGIWWHDAMRKIQWGAQSDTRFQAILPLCPDPERASREWENLKQSRLWPLLHRPGVRVLAEVPFLTQAAAGHAIEGVMDLLIHVPGTGFVLVDWKTGLDDSPANLVDRYGAQLRVYRDSLIAFTGEDCSAYLYSTAAGDLAEVA